MKDMRNVNFRVVFLYLGTPNNCFDKFDFYENFSVFQNFSHINSHCIAFLGILLVHTYAYISLF